MPIPALFGQINAIHTGTAIPFGAQWTLGVGTAAYLSDLAAIDAAFETALNNSGIYQFVSSNVAMTSVLVKVGPDATGPSATFPANEPGGDTSTDYPQAAYLVTKNTDLGGRAGRGRLFIPGVPPDNVEPGGALNGTVLTGLQTAVTDLLGELGGADLPPYLLHQAGSPISTPTEITGLTVSSKIATQRRRLRP